MILPNAPRPSYQLGNLHDDGTWTPVVRRLKRVPFRKPAVRRIVRVRRRSGARVRATSGVGSEPSGDADPDSDRIAPSIDGLVSVVGWGAFCVSGPRACARGPPLVDEEDHTPAIYRTREKTNDVQRRTGPRPIHHRRHHRR